MKNKLGRPRSFDREEALDIAILVFWEFGYEAADTKTLAQRIGVAKPSLYNAFGSKEELFLLALSHYRKQQFAQFKAILDQAESVYAGVLGLFEDFARQVSGDKQPSGCLIATIALPLVSKMPSVANLLFNSPNPQHQLMLDFFQHHKACRHLTSEFDSIAAVSLLRDLFIAMSLQGRIGGSLESLLQVAKRNADLVLLEGSRQQHAKP